MLLFTDKYLKASQKIYQVISEKQNWYKPIPYLKFKIQKTLKNVRLFHIFGGKDLISTENRSLMVSASLTYYEQSYICWENNLFDPGVCLSPC